MFIGAEEPAKLALDTCLTASTAAVRLMLPKSERRISVEMTTPKMHATIATAANAFNGTGDACATVESLATIENSRSVGRMKNVSDVRA
jgi:hypothetical protein